jgi:GT2 family glycosyltransferase
MPDEAPPVVAVVVASDPGPWFEESLAALGNQDYPNLSVLVVDAASLKNPAPRVARVLPQAFVRRAERNKGFSATANDALQAVRGASHLLFCHDDVAPAPDAVRKMVEEAYRSNAGVVAPKLVAWHEPDRLLQVGLGADRYACPVARVEAGEIDQSQHDEVRDVFAAPGGCMLVRADLFETLGGFDEEISLFGEDIDFCWRAQIAGARVVVAPSAVVRHLEATAGGVRRRPDKRTLQRRHELRAVLKNYGILRRTLVVTQLAVLSLLEAAYAIATNDRVRARRVASAWRWNFRRARHLGKARRAVRHTRHVPDRVVCAQQSPSQRVRRFVTAELTGRGARAGHREHPSLARTQAWLRKRSRGRSEAILVVSALIVVLAIGLRGPIIGGLPLVGGFGSFTSAGALLAKFFVGWRAAGATQLSNAPTAFGMLGLAGSVIGGAMGQLQKIVVLGAIAAGGIGAGRLVAPFGSTRARLVAAICYLALPLVWNDFARGDLPAIAVFAGAPYLLGRLVRAARFEPFTLTCPIGVEMIGLGLLVAVVGSFAPVFFLITLIAAVLTALGSLVTGQVQGTRRMLAVAGGGCVLAFILTLPWSVSFLEGGARWSVLSGALGLAATAPDLGELVRFEIGPMGAGVLGVATLAAAAFPLLVARGPRLSHAARWWVVGLGFFAVAWAGTQGWLGGSGGGDSGAFLAIAGVAVSACVALGMVAFEQDLAGFRFGWRQPATFAAAACAVVGLLPFLAWSTQGRYTLPAIGYDQVLTSLQPTTSTPYRVLWLGQPGALPMTSWQIERGYAAGVTDSGLPDATALWPSPSPGAAGPMLSDVSLATSGLTVQLGHSLAPLGVRYILVPTASAPVLAGIQSADSLPPPSGLVPSLVLQQDLKELPSVGGIYVFVNSAWSPSDYSASVPGAPDAPLSFLAGAPGAALELILFLGAGVIVLRRRVRPRSERGLLPARPAQDRASSSTGRGRARARRHGFERTEVPPIRTPLERDDDGDPASSPPDMRTRSR